MTTLLIDHLWQSTVVLFAAWVLVIALRNHEARVRYWIWLAVSVKFLVPFAALVAIGNELEWLATAMTPAQPVDPGLQALAQPMATLMPAAGDPAAAVIEADDGVAAAAFASAWILGLAFVLGRWLLSWLRLKRLVRTATPLALRQLEGLGVEARLSPSKIEPGVVGILRPVLLLPDGILQRLSTPQLEAVIAHELCHVRRRDNLTAAAHMVVQAVFWFHPLVWWIGARLVEERERACDEAVVASGVDPRTYAQGILAVCRLYFESPLPCAAGVGAGATLKDRVQRIAARWTARRLSAVWASGLGAAALVVVVAPIVVGSMTVPGALAQAQPASTPSVLSVSIERGDTTQQGLSFSGPRIEARDMPLRQLIAVAHDLQDYEVTGPPEIDSRGYTITVESQLAPGYDPVGTLRALLEQRFGLEGHREAAEVDALVLGRAARTRPRDGDPAASEKYIQIRPDGLDIHDLPLRSLSMFFSKMLGKPIVDETGLTGTYSYELRWGPTVAGEPPTQAVVARALEEQLGLSLTEERRSVERFVVDRIEEPTAQ